MGDLATYMSVHHVHAWCLGLELQTAVSQYVGVGNEPSSPGRDDSALNC